MQVKNFYINVGFKKTNIKNKWCYNLFEFSKNKTKLGKVEFIE